MAVQPKATTTRLTLPSGVSGAEPQTVPVGSLAYALDTDKVRVLTSIGWADVGGTGGGGITSVTSTGGTITVTNPSGPVVNVEVTVPFKLGYVGNPYIDPPVTASPYDDEFSSGSADLAVRGWTVVDVSSGATMTRVGNVDINVTSFASNTYRSTISGTWLFIQSIQTLCAFKAITPGDATFALRGRSANQPFIPGGIGTNSSCMLFQSAASAPPFATPARVEVGWQNGLIRNNQGDSGGTEFNQPVDPGTAPQSNTYAAVADLFTCGQTFSPASTLVTNYEAASGRDVFEFRRASHGGYRGPALNSAGFLVSTYLNISDAPRAGMVQIDYFRRISTTYNGWFVP